MSLRSFGDANGRKGNGKSKISERLREATLATMEQMEKRVMLNAVVVAPQSPQNLAFQIPGFSSAPSSPEPPAPGRTFWLNGNNGSTNWLWNSAITPVTTNDLVLNVTAFSQNYTPCCEADNGLGGIGCTGSVNAGRLLTNGLTQNQVGNFPSGQAKATGSGLISDSSSPMATASQNGTAGWFLEYNLGNYANFNGSGFVTGSAPNSTGYDISEIDVMAGHQDYRTGMQNDIQVQFVGGNTTDWFSLSNGNNFSFTADPSQGGAQVTRGGAQMAIVNSTGGNIASHVRSIKFIAVNQQTWYRELVVLGTQSGPNPSTVIAPGVTLNLELTPPAGRVDVNFTIPTQPNQDTQLSTSYAIQRAQVVNGVVGTFATIGGTAQNQAGAPITFIDGGAPGGSLFEYRIVASGPGASSTGPASSTIQTPFANVEAHYYNQAFWSGPVWDSTGLPQLGTNNGGAWAPGIGGSQDSAVFTGKVVTNQAGVYTFINNSDDDGYLYVDGVLVSSDPGGHGVRDAGLNTDINNIPIGTVVPISLAANTAYDFVMLEHNAGGGAAANMLWITPSNPGIAARQLVPIPNLLPISDTPAQPSGLTAISINANFVNFTFTANNQGVVDYVLQREDVSANTTSNSWFNVTQIYPASNSVQPSNAGQNVPITAVTNATVTIQDASPIPGESYIYRVLAQNYDGSIASPTTISSSAIVSDVIGVPSGPATLATASDMVSPPNSVPATGTVADANGLTAGTYFVQYSWVNAFGSESQSSSEVTIPVTALGDVQVAVTLPAGISNANIFVASTSGGEKLAGNVTSGQTLTISALPAITARSVPAKSLATLTTVPDSTGLAIGTYFVEYAWNNSVGATTASSREQTVVIAGQPGDINVALPATISAASNANVYIANASGAEKLAGTVNGGATLTVKTLPSTTAAAPTVNNAGLAAGTYFVQYNWVNLGTSTPSSFEQTIVLGTAGGDIRVAPPTTGAQQNSNVYISTTTATEKLAGNVNAGSTFVVQALPSTAAAAAPATAPVTLTTTADATGLAAGTYYVKYTWTDSAYVVNAGNAGETAASAEQSVVLTAAGDINVGIPALPAGAVNANVYVASQSGKETLYGAAAAGTTLPVKTLFTVAKAAPTSSTAGLAAGTYFVAYTWLGNQNLGTVGGQTGETSAANYVNNGPNTWALVTDESSIVLTSRADLKVSNFGSVPSGAANVNVYVGTSSGGETLQTLGSGANYNPTTIGRLGMSPTSTLTLNTLTQPINVSLLPVNAGNVGIGAILQNTTANTSGTTNVLIPPQSISAPPGIETRMYDGRILNGGDVNTAQGSAGQYNGSYAVNYNVQAALGLPTTQLNNTNDAVEYKPQTVNQSVGTFLPGVIDKDYNAQNVVIPGAPIVQSPDPVRSPDIPRIEWEDFGQIFSGKVQVGVTGAYTIMTNSDDAGFAWVNGTLVSADPGGHGQQDTLFGSVNVSGATGNGSSPLTLTVANAIPTSYTGLLINVNGVAGETAANGNWYAKVTSSTTIQLYQDPNFTVPVVGNGSYSSNGTVGFGSLSPSVVSNTTTAIANAPTRAGDTLTPVVLQAGQSYNLTMISQNVGGGAGAHLKWIEPRILDGQLAASATGLFNSNATISTITLSGSTIVPTFSLVGYSMYITSGTGRNQNAVIIGWDSTNRIATVIVTNNGSNLMWTTLPNSTSNYAIAMYEPIPLAGADAANQSAVGGLSLYQDAPVQSSWNPASVTVNGISPGGVTATTSGSAAGNVGITGIDPRSGVTITWSNQGVSELWWEVQRSSNGGTSWTTVGTTAFNIGQSFTDQTANNAFNGGATYLYRVRGVNFDGAGPFTAGVSTSNGLHVSAPTISAIVQGSPGTAGLLFNGAPASAVDTGGLDIQYATLTGGVTGTFVDATPVSLPISTFDYQVTGLTSTQQYVFKARYTTSLNNSNPNLFSAPVAFTPSGGVQESFGSPGTGVANWPTTSDVVTNGNGSLTGAGIPSVPTPSQLQSGSQASTANDLGAPGALATLSSASDVPPPSVTGGIFTTPNNSALTGNSTYYLEYTWVNGSGQETTPSTQQTLILPSGGYGASYIIPGTAPTGTASANIYIGTGTTASAEFRAGNVGVGATLVINSLPTTTPNAPIASSTGVAPGTYFIEYTWINAANQETQASPEATIVVTAPSNDINVVLPALPNDGFGAVAKSANIYLGTASGQEKLSINVTTGGTTTTIRGLPGSNQTPPTANNVGLPAGTYFVTYTWTSAEPNSTNGPGGEGNAAATQSIVLSSRGDLFLTVPPAANGANTTNVYIATPIANPTSTLTLIGATSAGSLTGTSTYFVNYEWVGSGATLPSTEQTIVPGGTNSSVTVTVPTAPFGASGARVFIGSSTGTETLAGTVGSGGNITINSLPVSAQPNDTVNTTSTTPIQAGSFFGDGSTSSVGNVGLSTGSTDIVIKTVPTSGNVTPPLAPTSPLSVSSVAGLANPTAPVTLAESPHTTDSSLAPNGTFYVEYTWLANAGGETAVSPEQSIVFNRGTADYLQVTLPSEPTGAGNANVYVGSAPGQEHLVGQAAAGTSINVKAVPSTTAAAAPTVSTTGLPAGTYFAEYSWQRGANSLESPVGPQQSFVLTNPTNVVTLTAGPSPFGDGADIVYLSTSTGTEVQLGQGSSGVNTLTFTTLPNINNKQAPALPSTAQRYFTPANALQLANNNNNQDTTIFNAGENITPGFVTSFDFLLNGNDGADAVAFVIQDNAQNGIGGGGGSGGYIGTNFTHSVAIMFNFYTPGGNANSTAFVVNANNNAGPAGLSQSTSPGFSKQNTWLDMTSVNGVPTGVDFSNNNAVNQRAGDIYNVKLAYDNTAHVLTETVTDLSLASAGVPNSFSTAYSIDLVAVLGMPAAYVGFSAASGGAAVEKDLLNWSWTTGSIIPLGDVISGTAAVDQITIMQDGDGIHTDWFLNGVETQMLITDPNGLTINGNGSNDVITLVGANPLPNTVHLNGLFTVNGLSGTNPLAGKIVDIGQSTVYVNYGSPGNDPLTVIQGYLKNGYNGGNWAGTSASGVITSSTAASGPSNTFGVGYADSVDGVVAGQPANTIEIRYTLLGDANLDRTVDLNDVLKLAAHFNGSGTTWDQGNFNYDNTTDLNDVLLLSKNFNGTVTGASASPAAAAATSAATTSSIINTVLSLPNTQSSGTTNSSSSSNTSDSSNSGSSNKGHSTGHSAKPAATPSHKKHGKNKKKH